MLKKLSLITIVLLLAACGPSAEESGVITAEEATRLAEVRQPTLDAQFTQFAQEFGGTLPSRDPDAAATLSTPLSSEEFAEVLSTPRAAELTATAGDPDTNGSDAAATAPQGGTVAPEGSQPTATPATPTGERVVASGGIDYPGAVPPVTPLGDIPGAVTGGDGWPTTLVDVIAFGQTVSEDVPTDIEAQNWQFTGQAGQTVTITVSGQGESDPRVKLIDPNGAVLAVATFAGPGGTETITWDLTETGVYTIRIDMWEVGTYTLTLG